MLHLLRWPEHHTAVLEFRRHAAFVATGAREDRVISNRLDLTRVGAPVVVKPLLDCCRLSAVVEINALRPVALPAHGRVADIQLVDQIQRPHRCIGRVGPDQGASARRTNTPVERQEALLLHQIDAAPFNRLTTPLCAPCRRDEERSTCIDVPAACEECRHQRGIATSHQLNAALVRLPIEMGVDRCVGGAVNAEVLELLRPEALGLHVLARPTC